MDHQLITYLENVIQLEKTVYTQNAMINHLQQTINGLGQYRTIHQRIVKERNFGELVAPVTTGIGAIGAGFGILAGLGSGGNIFSSFFNSIGYAIEYGLVGLAIGAVVGLARYFFCKASEKEDKKAAEEETNKAKAKDHQRVLAEKEQASRLMVLRNDLIQKRNETQAMLRCYYAANVLYEKYRHFTAVCMICEYLKSEKCYELKGHEGAYTLYDHESRLVIITSQLNKVLENLEAIKENQQMLYSAIREGNRTMEKVLQEAYKQTRLAEFTSEQSAIAAYNSGVAADEVRLANWLKIAY